MYQVTTPHSHSTYAGTHFLSHLGIHRLRALSRGTEIPPHFFKFGSFSNSDLEDALTMFFPEHKPHLYPLSPAFPQSFSQSPLQGSFLWAFFIEAFWRMTLETQSLASHSPPGSGTKGTRLHKHLHRRNPLPRTEGASQSRGGEPGGSSRRPDRAHVLFRQQCWARPKLPKLCRRRPSPPAAPSEGGWSRRSPRPGPGPLTLRMFS